MARRSDPKMTTSGAAIYANGRHVANMRRSNGVLQPPRRRIVVEMVGETVWSAADTIDEAITFVKARLRLKL